MCDCPGSCVRTCCWPFSFFAPYALAHARSPERADRCSDAVVKRLGRHFGLPHFAYPASGRHPSAENGGRLVAGTCKAWPADHARIIAAFAYDAGTEHEKALLLAVLEGPGRRVVASYRGVIPEDAATEVSVDSLRIDTARYLLSKNTRGFGLRLSAFRDRCTYDGGSDDALTLFVVDGETVRPVLAETLSHWRYRGGSRCGGEEVPRIDAGTLISVEPTASNGFADLRFTASRSDGKKPVSAVVRYNGQRYDLEPWRTRFDAWWD